MALLLREEDVRGILDMKDAIQWVGDGLRTLAEGRARNVPRQRVKMPGGMLHVLPAADLAEGVVGLKSYTSFKGGGGFLVLLYSAEDGRLLAVIEANYLGMMRTGAASGIATAHMARRDAGILALFGSGWQARGQLQGVALARDLKEVRVFSRAKGGREAFASEMAGLTGLNIQPVASPAEALEGASIVATATSSREPLFPAEAVPPGAHINAAGSNSLLRQELDARLVHMASLVVVDSRVQARAECGDLLVPAERGWIDWELLPELSDLVAGRLPVRQPSDITIFESQGIGLEDITVAGRLYRRAREAGVGEEVRLLDS